jgi:hypothetical protein
MKAEKTLVTTISAHGSFHTLSRSLMTVRHLCSIDTMEAFLASFSERCTIRRTKVQVPLAVVMKVEAP